MVNRVKKLREERLPSKLSMEAVLEKFPVDYKDCMNNVLRLEVARYNRLINFLHHSLTQLELALKGEIMMSMDLEVAYESLLFRNEIPISWKVFAFPTENTLRDFLKDLNKRVNFLRDWIDSGVNSGYYWLRAFYVPQSLITAIQLNYARSVTGVTVKQVKLKFKILASEEEAVKTAASLTGNSCVIRGLYIEGARWDSIRGRLAEALPKIFQELLPPIFIEATKGSSLEAEDATGVAHDTKTPEGYYSYPCPVYRTQLRKGEITPTGHSTNYIFTLDLPSDVPPRHWINRGVAAALELLEA